MSFDQRSYGGKVFRPTPEVHVEDDGSFGVIATPWGSRPAARKVIDILKDYVLSARQDMEATSPFQKLSCLSAPANSLRAGLMLANDMIYRDENKSEYISGVEVLVFSHNNGELAFAQVGYPHIYLARATMPWIPLSIQIDLSSEHSRPPEMLPPLPQNLIGLHNTTNMNVSSFKTQPGDKLVFLSHSIASHPFFALRSDQTTVESVTVHLSKANPEMPFWLGLLSF